jgi:hypothetical protein
MFLRGSSKGYLFERLSRVGYALRPYFFVHFDRSDCRVRCKGSEA